MKYLVSLIFLFTLNLNAVEVVLQDPQLNEPAPKFSALDSNGKTISLDDFKGQPVILEWTNHECPYVVRHYKEDNMQKVQVTKSITKYWDQCSYSIGSDFWGLHSGFPENIKRDT